MPNQYSKVWTKEIILEKIRSVCEEKANAGDDMPTGTEWDETMVSPSRRTIEKYTGMKFNEVIHSLGYETKNKSSQTYTEYELLLMLRTYYEIEGKNPTSTEFKKNEAYPNPINYQRRFKSWKIATEAAGFKRGKLGFDKNVDIAKYNNMRKEKKVYVPKMIVSDFKKGEWSEHEEEFLKTMYLMMPYKDIAAYLNRTYDSVKVRANRLGITLGKINPFSCIKGERWSEEEFNILLDEYSHNPKIEELLPTRSRTAIIKMANKLGMKMKRGGSIVNSRFFEELNPQSAYIAGFIAADGYVNEKDHFLEITLSIKDQEHLSKMAHIMGEDLKLTSNKSDTITRLKIVNHKIVDDLVKLNIVQAKTYTLRYFEEMPNNCHSHFIRGYMDGDGSIMPLTAEGRLSILGNKHFIESISEIISKHCAVNLNKPDKKGNIVDLRYHQRTALKVLDWLYHDADIYLERKKLKYDEFKNKTNKM